MMALMDADSWRDPAPTGEVTVTTVDDDDLLMALFTRQYGSMVRMATALLRSRAIAEEVVQEAFVHVEPRLGCVAPEGHAAYLRQAVMNGARSAIRRDRAKKRQPILVREVSASPEDTVVLHDDQRRLLVMLDQLPLRQRQCLVLRYYEGLSDTEVAGALGISAGSAKTHIRRGLEALRTKLEVVA